MQFFLDIYLPLSRPYLFLKENGVYKSMCFANGAELACGQMLGVLLMFACLRLGGWVGGGVIVSKVSGSG